MDDTTQERVRETFSASNEGRIHFGEVVARMVAAGVESYAVDYRSHRTTFFFADDATLTLDSEATPISPAQAFDVDAIRAGIRGSQQGLIRYPEFRQRSMQAGCVGYTAWIAGRQVTYFGRKGETHVERFPD